MKRYKQYFIGFLFILILINFSPQGTLSSKIVEVTRFSHVLQFVTPGCLLILDIDDTLIEPKQTLGSDVWFRWRIKYYIKEKGMQKDLALETALMEWVAVQHLTEVNLVEPGISTTVEKLQKSGFCVMGLTTRGASVATRTIQQLNMVNIDLSLSAPIQEEVVFLNPHELIYKKGILFTAGTHKGEGLFKFLKHTDQKNIASVIFINDKKSHLEQVQKSCRERGCSFTGLRYSAVDERVKNFSEEIAKYQFERFGNILSDEEAKQALLK